MRIDLTGKRAVVCGSTQGIGEAIALQLAQHGAEVILLARNELKLRQVSGRLAMAQGQKHQVLAVDLSNREALALAAKQLSRDRVDILINNSGGPAPGPLHQVDAETFIGPLQQHLLSSHTLVQYLVPGMKEAGYGRIVNIISTSIKQVIPGLGISNAVRGAVAQWAKTLAIELGPFGITVNNILPGATETGRLQAVLAEKAKRRNVDLADVIAEEKAAIPLRRFAAAEEVAYGALFLVSPMADYINGINLPVDGGRLSCL